LSPKNSLFAIPLDQQYTEKALTRSGINALKGKDKSVATAVAGAEGWKVLIAQMKRTNRKHCRSGWGDSDSDDYNDDDENGDIQVEGLYHADGSDAQMHGNWILKQLDMDAVEDDGMIMEEDYFVDQTMWQPCSKGKMEYPGNCVTYTVGMLIVFSDAGVFEHVCQSNIHNGVAEVVKDPQLLRRLLAFIEKKKPTLSYDDFGKLYPMLASSGLDVWESFRTFVSCLCKLTPTPEVAAIFSTLVKELGWNENTKPIMSIVESIPSRSTALHPAELSNTANFLHLMDLAEKDGYMNEVLSKVVAEFVATIVEGKGEEIWSSQQLVDLLFKWGNATQFQALHKWVAKASLATITKVRSCLERSTESSLTEAKGALTKMVIDGDKDKAVGDLVARKDKLEEALRGGKPEFLWRMPTPITPVAALREFLQSDQQATEIIVGGGIKNAKLVYESADSGCYYGTYYNTPNEVLKRGFSVDMRATGVGHRARLEVKKTRDYYEAKLDEYEKMRRSCKK
jgi:hypothetical protein